MSLGLMSPVEFKKWPCDPVNFRSLDPYPRLSNTTYDFYTPPPTSTHNIRLLHTTSDFYTQHTTSTHHHRLLHTTYYLHTPHTTSIHHIQLVHALLTSLHVLTVCLPFLGDPDWLLEVYVTSHFCDTTSAVAIATLP